MQLEITNMVVIFPDSHLIFHAWLHLKHGEFALMTLTYIRNWIALHNSLGNYICVGRF